MIINCPTVICSPTVCYFSREKPLVKPTTPGLFLILFSFAIYAYLLLFLDLLNQKYKNTLLQFILFGVRSINIYNSLTSICRFLAPLPERDWQPLLHVGLRVFVIVCRCYLCCVSWFSYWFDNLGFITEGNTYRCCVASSLPLWENTDVASSDNKRNF